MYDGQVELEGEASRVVALRPVAKAEAKPNSSRKQAPPPPTEDAKDHP
jgi:hypothetical protein